MAKILCIYNQKGGVGKTTTVVNLSAALGRLKKKVLVVDIDPQGNSTSGLGVAKHPEIPGTYQCLLRENKTEDCLVGTTAKNVDLLPSNPALAGFEIEAVSIPDREHLLRECLDTVRQNYDYIFIDCPPSLGLLSLNALCAADGVIVPIQCEYYALEGVGQLMETLELVQNGLNPDLEITGVVLSMFDGRNNLALDVVEEVKKYFRDKVFRTVIPRNIRLAEAPSYGQSVLDYDPKSKGAMAYQKLAKEFLKREK